MATCQVFKIFLSSRHILCLFRVVVVAVVPYIITSKRVLHYVFYHYKNKNIYLFIQIYRRVYQMESTLSSWGGYTR